MTAPHPYDVAVIGGGPAGLSAALVLARARRRVLVIDSGAPRNAPATHMHGYLSRDGTAPGELLAAGRAEIARYGAELHEGRVVAARPGFELDLDDGRRITCHRLVVATGVTDELPTVDGLRARWGRDVLHCPYCHGWEVRDEPLCVIGHVAGSVDHALLVRQWSPHVTYITHTAPPTERERTMLRRYGIAIVDAHAMAVVANEHRVEAVRLADARTLRCRAIFVRPTPRPKAGELLIGLACRTSDNGFPVVDDGGRTSVPGLWVVGNLADPTMQVISAAGAGATAGMAINHDLVHHGDYTPTTRTPAPSGAPVRR